MLYNSCPTLFRSARNTATTTAILYYCPCQKIEQTCAVLKVICKMSNLCSYGSEVQRFTVTDGEAQVSFGKLTEAELLENMTCLQSLLARGCLVLC